MARQAAVDRDVDGMIVREHGDKVWAFAGKK